MKTNNKNILIKKVCGFIGLYMMMTVLFGGGIILIHTDNVLASQITESSEQSVNYDKNILDRTSMFQEADSNIQADREAVYEEVQQALIPVYEEKFIRIKSDVEGLNIRKKPTLESDVLGVMYQGEIAIASIPYVLGEVVEEEWTALLNGYVNTQYIEIIEDSIDLLEYRLTPKGTYTKNPVLSSTVTVKSYVSAESLSGVTEGTELEGIETAIVSAEENYGINGLFIYAVARLESGTGTSHLARTKNNLFGMNAQDHDPYNLAFTYDSIHESVIDFADRISKYYVDQGLTTVESINEKYSSDPEWNAKVLNIMSDTYQQIIE